MDVSVTEGEAVLLGLFVGVELLVGVSVWLAGGEAVNDSVEVGELVMVVVDVGESVTV